MTENESVSEQAAPPSGASLLMIDTLVFQLLPRGYAWPASALTGFDMQRLNEIKEATRKPVTELLRDAVDLLYEATASERRILAEQKVATRKRVRKVVEAPAAKKAVESSVGLSVARGLFDRMLDDDGPCMNQSVFDAMRTAGQSMTVAAERAESDEPFSSLAE